MSLARAEQRLATSFFGDLPLSPSREQRIRDLRGRLCYFRNGVAAMPLHSRENDGFGMEDAVFHALVREEPGFLIGADLPNETYNIPRMKGVGGSDIWGFTIGPDGVYVLDRTWEVRSGKYLDVQEALGKQRSLIERSSQKPVELLYVLQYVFPKHLPFPKNLWISQPRDMTVTFVGVEEVPNEPVVDLKGRFPNVFYRQFDRSQGEFVLPKAA